MPYELQTSSAAPGNHLEGKVFGHDVNTVLVVERVQKSAMRM
jgi:hypothetical protein